MAQPLQMPALVTREVKGSELTHAEMDQNLTTLRNFCNAIASFFGIAVNTDGTLQVDSVSEDTIQDREISARKIKLNFLPVVNDTGTVNAIAVTNDPPLTAYVNGLVFFIHLGNLPTGAMTINADGLGDIPLLKNGGQTIEVGDLLQHQLICAAYKDGNFYLLQATQSSGSSGSSGGASGLVKYEPSAVALPGNGLTASFTHALAATPDQTDVVLINTVAEYGYAQGVEVPIGQFVTVDNAPAFAVEVDSSNIIITQLAAAVYVARTDSSIGTLVAITDASWNVKVRAEKTTESSPLIFPALDISAMQPDSAIGYGTNIFFFSHGKSSNKCFLNRLDMSTGKIYMIANLGAMDNINAGVFRSSTTGDDILVWSSSIGIFWIPLQDPTPDAWSATEYGSMGSTWQDYKPVQVVETGAGSQLTPVIYAVRSNLASGSLNAIVCQKITSSSGTGAEFLPKLNLLTGSSSDIVNIAEFQQWHTTDTVDDAKLLHFQFNPIKKRIYIITDETMFVHIFTINTSDFQAWWSGASREANMTYVKALALCGGGTGWGISQHCRFTVEFDLTSGQEKSLTYTRDNADTNKPGTITRVPWLEG